MAVASIPPVMVSGMRPIGTPIVSPAIIPMTTPSVGIAHHVVRIVPVARCGEHVGIHTIVIDIPLPAGPERTAIDYIPIERTAHGDSIARIAETHDAHGILIIGIATIETMDPSLAILNMRKAQGVGVHPKGITLFGNENETIILHGKF